MENQVIDEVKPEAIPVVEESAADAIRRGYEKVAEPDKPQEPVAKEPETVPEEQAKPTEETPPAINGKQLEELMARTDRISELERQLRDENGRYGAIKQSLDRLQQKIAESTTRQELVANTADANELLADLREEYPELAKKLEGAFSKVLASKGIDQSAVDKLVDQRLASEKEAAESDEFKVFNELLLGFHPDMPEIGKNPDFSTWMGTLNPRLRARIEASRDAYFIADQIDAFKEWQKSKTEAKPQDVAPSKRLSDAVLPTTGAKVATTKTVDPKASIRAGYERVAGKRL